MRLPGGPRNVSTAYRYITDIPSIVKNDLNAIDRAPDMHMVLAECKFAACRRISDKPINTFICSITISITALHGDDLSYEPTADGLRTRDYELFLLRDRLLVSIPLCLPTCMLLPL